MRKILICTHIDEGDLELDKETIRMSCRHLAQAVPTPSHPRLSECGYLNPDTDSETDCVQDWIINYVESICDEVLNDDKPVDPWPRFWKNRFFP